MKKILLSLFVLASLSAKAASSSALKIESAYEDSNGRLMVYLNSPDSTGKSKYDFIKGNSVFYGTEKTLFQLSLKGASGGPLGEGVSFEDPRLMRNGEFNASFAEQGKPATASVRCDGEKIEYKPVSRERLQKLQALVQSGKTALAPLPSGERSGQLHTPCDRLFPSGSQPQQKSAEKKAKSAV